MPRYGLPSKTIRIVLPSTSGAEVWAPGELDYWDETRILSRSQRTELNPLSQQQLTIVDSAVFEYELLHVALEHPDAGWNLFDEQDRAYERDRTTIDRIFAGQDGRRDRNHILKRLGDEFFPEMVKREASEVVASEAPEASNGQVAEQVVPPPNPIQQPVPPPQVPAPNAVAAAPFQPVPTDGSVLTASPPSSPQPEPNWNPTQPPEQTVVTLG